MSIANGDVLRVACRLRARGGQDIVNVYHYEYDGTGAPDSSILASLVDHMDDMYTPLQPGLPSTTSFIDIDVANVTQGTVFPAMAWPTLTVGGASADELPEQVCGVVIGRTDLPKVVGRKFFGPLTETATNHGAFTSSMLSTLALVSAEYLADVVVQVGCYLFPGVARYASGGLVNRFVRILESAVSSGVFTQRRRRAGQGS